MNRTEKWTKALADARSALLETLNGLSPEQWEQVVYGEGDGGRCIPSSAISSTASGG